MEKNDKRLVEIFEKLNNVKLNLNENLNEKRKKISKNINQDKDNQDETPEEENGEQKQEPEEKEDKKNDFDVNSDDDVNKLVKQKDDAGDVVKGGLGKDSTSVDFDFEQLKRGLKVELEHSDDPLVALDIAYDHLVEDDKYYGEDDEDAEKMSKKSARKDV